MASKEAVLCRGFCLLLFFCGTGAKHLTPNFEVEAPTVEIAKQVALTAERCREELAVDWLGHSLPKWSARCQVRVKVGQVGAGGATTFSFSGGHVYGWDMTVQGSLERILDSVIPHEVSHTIFASHFRRPLPRWADEGAATLAEEDSERRRQQKLAEEVMPTQRRIPLRELLQITEYPKNMQHVLTLYAQGFSLANYLVQKGGKVRFLAFIQEAHEIGWDSAFRKHYDESNIEALEQKWSQWIISGSPALRQPDGVLLAVAKNSESLGVSKSDGSVVRSQTPEEKLPKSRGESVSPGRTVVAASGSRSTNERNGSNANIDAPQPRRSSRTAAALESQSSPRDPSEPPTRNPDTLVAKEPLSNNSSDSSRLPRGSHLIRPELRRAIAAVSSRDNSSIEVKEERLRPSPFATIVTAETGASSRNDDVEFANHSQSDSVSDAGRSAEIRVGSPERSSRQATPVRPVFERESTLRFKPFRSR